MTTVLLTGGSGLVGSHILRILANRFTWLNPSSNELNITESAKTTDYINHTDFDLCLHLAAFTNVDLAETAKEQCYQVNVIGTKNLFQAVKQKHKPFIFISTDFVFSGQEKSYDEHSTPKPINYYGQSKYEAEQLVKNQAMIIRLSYPYGSLTNTKPDFVKAILKRLSAGQPVQGIKDTVFTPTFLDDIAWGLAGFIEHFEPKIFHLVGSESLSPYQAFTKIAATFNFDKKLVQPTIAAEYFQNKAKRPKNGAISSCYQFIKTHSFSAGLALVKARLSC